MSISIVSNSEQIYKNNVDRIKQILSVYPQFTFVLNSFEYCGVELKKGKFIYLGTIEDVTTTKRQGLKKISVSKKVLSVLACVRIYAVSEDRLPEASITGTADQQMKLIDIVSAISKRWETRRGIVELDIAATLVPLKTAQKEDPWLLHKIDLE